MEEGLYWLNMVAWTRVYALATIGTGIVLFITVILIWRQQRAYGRTQELQAFVQVAGQLQDENVRKARRRVYELREMGGDAENWDIRDKWQAEIVCHNFNVVGDMLEKKLITKRVLEGWAWTIKECWKIVKPLIEHYREQRSYPGLWRSFQKLAEETFETKKKE